MKRNDEKKKTHQEFNSKQLLWWARHCVRDTATISNHLCSLCIVYIISLFMVNQTNPVFVLFFVSDFTIRNDWHMWSVTKIVWCLFCAPINWDCAFFCEIMNRNRQTGWPLNVIVMARIQFLMNKMSIIIIELCVWFIVIDCGECIFTVRRCKIAFKSTQQLIKCRIFVKVKWLFMVESNVWRFKIQLF